VSVLVAAYKEDAYLELALRDALGQTHAAVEVIVSDDAASDATRVLVDRLGDARLVYRANPVRLGAAGNHRAALEAARGEFVTVLNHDDRWEPDFLESLLAPLVADPTLSLAFCDHWVIDAAGKRLDEATDANTVQWGRDRLLAGRQESFPRLVVNQSIPLAMGAVFRRATINPADLPGDAGPAYDVWLTYLLSRAGGGAWYVPRRLTNWRVHPRSQTAARAIDWTVGGIRFWEAAIADPAFAPHRDEIRRSLALGYRSLAVTHLRAGDHPAARRVARLALRHRWADPRTWAVLALACAPQAVAGRLLRRNRVS
jgi:glycosyltransferase involved in cell wall biosynthesis